MDGCGDNALVVDVKGGDVGDIALQLALRPLVGQVIAKRHDSSSDPENLVVLQVLQYWEPLEETPSLELLEEVILGVGEIPGVPDEELASFPPLAEPVVVAMGELPPEVEKERGCRGVVDCGFVLEEAQEGEGIEDPVQIFLKLRHLKEVTEQLEQSIRHPAVLGTLEQRGKYPLGVLSNGGDRKTRSSCPGDRRHDLPSLIQVIKHL